MDEAKKQWLEAKGWKVGSVDEFLGLSPAEAAYIELKLILSEALRTYREQKKLTQVELAEQLKSSKSSVAEMEAGEPSVSLDLLIRSLLSLGVTTKNLGKMIAA